MSAAKEGENFHLSCHFVPAICVQYLIEKECSTLYTLK